MGLRNLLGCCLAVLLLACAEASYRHRRQSPETKFYQPPLLLNSAPQPIPMQNYQPPISRQQPQATHNFEYRSPLEYASSGQHQSVSYVPHDSSQSISVHQQPASSERTSKVVESSASVQTIHKAPASEIEAKKESLAKEKDAAKDEYVVYYYYYYDNDTTAGNASSSNFDDIPSLESYDDTKLPEKIQTNVGNALDDSRNISSQARSVSSQGSDAFIRADRPAQPMKPVSNVARYGSNEVPRFPVLPNFVVSEVSTTTTTEGPSPQSIATSQSPTSASSLPAVEPEEDDAVNSVLDNTKDLKESKVAEADETTTTTTTEPPTTTEEETTTTERSTRRRPSLGGSRRRFNPNPASSPASTRSRNPPSRSSTSSTSSTSTTTTATPTRRTFQGSNRIRSRPSLGSRSNTNEDRSVSRPTTESTTTSTTPRGRFSSAAPARRFQSSRSRSQASSSSTSTSTTTRSPPPRSRPATSRPRPNLISRNRPPRPGFLRPKPEEVAETTTPTPAEPEETSPPSKDESAATAEEDSEESEETSEEEEESEPTTTEASRFSALFRPRNRNALSRPRPVVGNRPSRS